jgi:hypothetical protein
MMTLAPKSLFARAFVVLTVLIAAIAPGPARAATASSNTALDWNLNAVAAVRAARTMDGVAPGGSPRALYQTEGLLYVSYAQAAVYDAVMKLTNRYSPYHHFVAPAGDASTDAAVIAAAYNTLVFYLGDPNHTLAAEYRAAVGALPNDAKTARGIRVGELAASDIEQLRANDGRNAPVSDACPTDTTPGAWRCAPTPSLQSEQTPWMAAMQPFILDNDSQFRAAAPPALGTSQYLTDLEETKNFGAANSTIRTPDETAIAYFWNANAINQLNQALRGVSAQYGMDLSDTVRLLAAGDMVSTDAGMACFDSKYFWLRWRPVTAIRLGSDFTDPTWTPLVTTPNHPEYPSQHGCITSALADVLVTILGTSNFNVTIAGAQGGATTLTTSQTFATESDLDTQLVNARVWIGFHYRTSVVRGEELGHSVADWSMARFFLPGDDMSE